MIKNSVNNKLKLLVLGLDGATFNIIKPMIANGELPNLAALMAEGTHGELTSTIPPITPAAWASFMTGTNPGQHGILNFLVYNPLKYNLEAKTVSATSLAGLTFWDVMGKVGYRVAVITVPLTYPVWPINGYMVPGNPCPDEAKNNVYPAEFAAELSRPYTFPSWFWSTGTNDEFFHKGIEMDASRTDLMARLIEEKQINAAVIVLGATDRAVHAFWRYHDPEFGATLGIPEEKDFSDAIRQTYRAEDENIGKLLKYVQDDTLVMVVSDHGGGPAAVKHFHVNAWLQELGLLRPKQGGGKAVVGALQVSLSAVRRRLGTRLVKQIMGKLPTKVTEQARGLSKNVAQIDWLATQAFDFPMYPPIEGIELNVIGRQPKGIVQPGQAYEKLRDYILEQAELLTDPDTGERIIRRAQRREEVYSGERMELMPDIVLFLNEKYMGGHEINLPLVTPVHKKVLERVNGQHQMEGVLIARHNRIIKKGCTIEGARLMDVPPTILYALDLPVPARMDGVVLKDLFTSEHLAEKPVLFSKDDTGSAVDLEDTGLTPEQEEQIKAQLERLGYL
ncbi:MAG: alkaline phosphatase family protein [Anaerolineae bacterium]|nr:alkaline phosphatase family protein [Anaerolineae bacterium]